MFYSLWSGIELTRTDAVDWLGVRSVSWAEVWARSPRLVPLHLPDNDVQDRVHQAAQYTDAPGWLLPHSAEQRQLLEDVDGIVILQLLCQPWERIPGIRGQQEEQEGWGFQAGMRRPSELLRPGHTARVWMALSEPSPPWRCGFEDDGPDGSFSHDD